MKHIKASIPVIRATGNSTSYCFGKCWTKAGDMYNTQERDLISSLRNQVLNTIIVLGGYGEIKVEYLATGKVLLNLYNYDTTMFSPSRSKRFRNAVDALNNSIVSTKIASTQIPQVRITLVFVVG